MSPSYVLVVTMCTMAVMITAVPVNNKKLSERQGRTPAIFYRAESTLQSFLKRDTRKCALRMMCTIGADSKPFGVIGERISNWFGYYLDPVNFNIIPLPVTSMLNSTRTVNKVETARMFSEPPFGSWFSQFFQRFSRFPFLFYPFRKVSTPAPENKLAVQENFEPTTSVPATTIHQLTTSAPVTDTVDDLPLTPSSMEIVDEEFEVNVRKDDDFTETSINEDGEFDATNINKDGEFDATNINDAVVLDDTSADNAGVVSINYIDNPMFIPDVAPLSGQSLRSGSFQDNAFTSDEDDATGNSFSGRSFPSESMPMPMPILEVSGSEEVPGRTFLPATNMLNAAFLKGYMEGSSSCLRTFVNCTMSLQQLVSLSSNLFGFGTRTNQ